MSVIFHGTLHAYYKHHQKVLRTELKNPVKLDWTRKVSYLLLCVLYLLLPNFKFLEKDCSQGYVFLPLIWDFSNIS